MKSLQIATVEFPIRASMLPMLWECEKMFLERYKMEIDGTGGEGGAPAQTGSLTHLGINAYHSGLNWKDAIKIGAKLYPLADVVDSIYLCERYVRREEDKTAVKGGTVIANEVPGMVLLPAAPHDKTKEKIAIRGTLDQLRLSADGGTIDIRDHKTGYMEPATMVQHYTLQLAAYLFIAMQPDFKPLQKLKKRPTKFTASIGRIVALRRTNLKYILPMPFDSTNVEKVLDIIANKVAALRNGVADASPGRYCSWCPLKQYPDCIGVQSDKRISLQSAKKTDGGLKTAADLFGM